MTPQQQAVLRRPHPSTVNQKVELTFKLFVLENARNTLEQELLNVINKAYEEVQGFLNSSFQADVGVFSELTKALDTKCETIGKLSTLLKDLAVEPHFCVQPDVKNGVSTNLLQPHSRKGILMVDVLKFGPMLQNSLMASSIAKALQVLGASLSHQQLTHFPISQHALGQQDVMLCSISSSSNSTVATTSSSIHLKMEDKEQVVFEEKLSSDAAILPPAIIKKADINPERPPLLPPILPEISNPKPMTITPLMCWGCEEDLQVQHQKQTSSQLLHFLRAKAKTTGALEVTVMEWCKSMCTLPQWPSIKTQSCQPRDGVPDDLISALAPKTLHADIENQAPVFRVKRVESSGSLTYTCVIATKTELWDIGDIFIQVGLGDSEASPLENKDCPTITAPEENSCLSIPWKSQTLKCTEPEIMSHFAGAKMPAITSKTIPEFQTRKFEETEVVVSHIVSPGNFYIQHADSLTKLQGLVTDSWKASSSYAEQNCIPDIGTKVMGWFSKQEQWCRAQVTKICGVSGDNNATHGAGSETSIQVEVKKLDHGDTACLSLLNIKELTPEMAILPLQAVQVSLANVMPVNGSHWSEEAVGWFKAMVHNRTLYARLYPHGPKVTVELFLEKGKLGTMRRGASLSLRLAQNGHAKHDKLKNASLTNKSTVRHKMSKQDSEWEKYLISCYTGSKSYSESRECV